MKQDDEQESKNTLGAYFVEGLIIEGLYKKTIFMVNPDESLKILRNFKDYSTYQEVFKQKFLKQSPDSKANFLPQLPKNKIEEEYTTVKLEQMLFAYNVLNHFQLISLRFYK